MDAEARPCRGGPRRKAPLLGVLALSAAAALSSAGCYAPKSTSETAPSTAPAAPEPAPPPPAVAPVEPAEMKKEQDARELEDTLQTPAAGPTRRVAPPAKVAPKPTSKSKASGAFAQPPASEGSAGVGSSGDAKPTAAELRSRLDQAYGAASPDCPSARDRKKAVCDLASQICQLTDRDPNVASVAEYCDQARRRCSEAERRTGERCPG
jgi:hypothetical protein